MHPMRPPGAEEASGRTAAPSTAVGTPPVSRRPSPRRRRRLRRPPVSRRLRRPPVSRRRSPRRRRRLRRPPAKLRLRRSHASCARVQRLLTRVDPRRLDGFEGRPESDCAARDGVDHALHYMRCVLAHRKLAKHITKCSGDAGAATRGRRRPTRRPAALLAEARRAHGRRGLGMLCAAASKRLSRRARAAREDRSTASARACRRRRRTSVASDDAKCHRSLGSNRVQSAPHYCLERPGTMPRLAAVIVHVVHSDASMRRTNPPRRAGVAAAWQQTAAGRAVGGRHGTARPEGPKWHRSGGPTTVGCRYVSSGIAVRQSAAIISYWLDILDYEYRPW